MSQVIGIDLGGSKIALGLVNPRDEIIARCLVGAATADDFTANSLHTTILVVAIHSSQIGCRR